MLFSSLNQLKMDFMIFSSSPLCIQTSLHINQNHSIVIVLVRSVNLTKKRTKKWLGCSKKFKWKHHNWHLMISLKLKSLSNKMKSHKATKKKTLIMSQFKVMPQVSKTSRNLLNLNRFLPFKRKTLLLQMIKKTFHRLIIKNQQNQGKNLLIQDLTVIKRKNKGSLKKM